MYLETKPQMDSMPWTSLFFYFGIIFLSLTTFIFFLKTYDKKKLKQDKTFNYKYWMEW